MNITIHIKSQMLVLHRNNDTAIKYSISTGSKGVGQQEGSWQTPMGRHLIRAKIGDGYPRDSVFVGRRSSGEIYSAEIRAQYPKRKDWILSRILWLSGLEKGFNRLGSVDTMRRYIYIHGSPDSAVMGVPGSRGCIRMKGADIIDLFDRIEAGIEVNIVPE